MQAKQYNPDLFIWAGYDADAIPILIQAKEIGFAPKLFVGAPPGWPADFGKNPLSHGVILYGMWAPALKDVSPIARHFWDAYVKEFNEEPATYFAPLGYTNIMFLIEGIKKAGSLDKDAIIKALREIEYDSPLVVCSRSPRAGSSRTKDSGLRKYCSGRMEYSTSSGRSNIKRPS
jgi:branched-chain amino acid transport system substrate-binding protein